MYMLKLQQHVLFYAYCCPSDLLPLIFIYFYTFICLSYQMRKMC